MSPTPYYQQVAEAIAAQIAAGTLKPGDPIPSELRLQQEWGVSRGTVRKAVATLVGRELVITVPQRGSYVKPTGS